MERDDPLLFSQALEFYDPLHAPADALSQSINSPSWLNNV